VPLFDTIAPIVPTAWIQETLAIARDFPLMNEKSKAERIISPILMEVGWRLLCSDNTHSAVIQELE
jgi:hypothetical protein